MNYKISVIVPVYKVEAYLDKCILSIVSQTYSNLELLLIDDGSPDQCPQICDVWAEKDDRIRVVHKKNEGVARARNLGMELASGDYVMFVDSDDYLPLNAIQLLLERLLKDGSDMVLGKTMFVFEDGREESRRDAFFTDSVFLGDDFLRAMGNDEHYNSALWAKMYNRKALQGIVLPNQACGEDLWVFPHIIMQCAKISVVNQFVYFYLQRQSSVMHTRKDQLYLENIRATQHMTEIYLEKKWFSCAARWFRSGVQEIQQMQNKRLGVEQIENLFTNDQINHMLEESSVTVRVKWFLLQHMGLYEIIFGLKRKLFSN